MITRVIFFLLLSIFSVVGIHAEKSEKMIMVASYNVAAGKMSSPEEVSSVFIKLNPDVLVFTEIPKKNWVDNIANSLNMPSRFIGSVSSANHKDKFKAILSKAPLENVKEYKLKADGGWNPASAVKAETTIRGVKLVVFGLHVAESTSENGHIYKLMNAVVSKDKHKNIILAGDFNNKISDQAIKFVEKNGFNLVWKDLDKSILSNSSCAFKNCGLIDHIFYKDFNSVKAVHGGVIDLKKPFSDHKPVWSVISY